METATNDPPQTSLAPVQASGTPAGTRPIIPEPFWRVPITWFRALTIERRVLASFSLVFVGILVISVVSYRNTRILIVNSRLDSRSHELVQLLANIDVAMNEAEDSHRRYLVTGETSYLETYQKLVEQKPTFIKYLDDLTKGSRDQQQRVIQLDQTMDLQLRAEAAAITELNERGHEAVMQLAIEGAAKQERGTTHRIIAELELYERQALRKRVMESAAGTTNTIVLLAVGALLQLVLLASVYYLIRHDIMERRRVAAELQRRGELLEAANKELEAFSYSVSHDLRAPLRHIDGYASLLRRAVGGSLDEKPARYLQTISESAKRMGQLIDDLLVFSRMGRQEMLNTTVNLDKLIKSIIYDLRLDLQGRKISWTIDILPEVPGDPVMLRQVFMNLIANAVKFTNTRPIAKIEIGVDRRTAREIVIFVRDNGVGFDMQYAAKLFGVFQRLHRADEFEGTGIGLANVRRIVHRHGGRTWAEGIPDKGATFYVAFPTRRSR
ncbi:MAG TPA: ATP-binding protein [Nitrospira sp.]|nr:ATP-binding protein [Nitrospira sp.]